jgi:hypothetical protein
MQVTEIVNGLYRFDLVWPAGTGVEIVLTLTDPDGEEESDVINWMADQDYPLRDALMGIVNAVDGLVHWRAIVSGPNISIGPASEDYSGNVEVSLYAQ